MARKVVKNVNRGSLSKDERLEFEASGFDEAEIERFQEELKAPRWEFWSKAADLFLTLKGGQEISYSNGKMRQVDVSSSVKFSNNHYGTADREEARLIFMSSPYINGFVKLAKEQAEDEAQRTYSEFKSKILSSKENVARLKEELASMP